jgi:glyoxylase-like metal-dependent hydrolase (beta-lactamase superfamily II)
VSGDTLFEDGIGRTDYPGGDKDQLMKSLKKLSKYSINYLLPGHGMPKTSGVNFLIKQVTSSRNDSVKDDI